MALPDMNRNGNGNAGNGSRRNAAVNPMPKRIIVGDDDTTRNLAPGYRIESEVTVNIPSVDNNADTPMPIPDMGSSGSGMAGISAPVPSTSESGSVGANDSMPMPGSSAMGSDTGSHVDAGEGAQGNPSPVDVGGPSEPASPLEMPMPDGSFSNDGMMPSDGGASVDDGGSMPDADYGADEGNDNDGVGSESMPDGDTDADTHDDSSDEWEGNDDPTNNARKVSTTSASHPQSQGVQGTSGPVEDNPMPEATAANDGTGDNREGGKDDGGPVDGEGKGGPDSGSRDDDGDSQSESDGDSDDDGNDSDGRGSRAGSGKDGEDNDGSSPSSGSKGTSDKDKKASEDGGGKKKPEDRVNSPEAKEHRDNIFNRAREGAKNIVKNGVDNAKANVKNTVYNGIDAVAGAPGRAIMDAKRKMDAAKAMAKKAKETAKAAVEHTKEAVRKLQAGAKTALVVAKTLLTPPQVIIEGIVILVVIAMVMVIGGLQVVGPSIIDCDVNGTNSSSEAGTSSGGTGDSQPGDFKGEVATRVFDFLTKEMGFSGAGAAGALAVANRESTLQPTAQNPSGGVAGLFQWSGFSNTINGTRITSEGSIKAGDVSTLTLENQLKLLRYELNGSYRNVKSAVGNATSPEDAARDWSALFEGVPVDDAAQGKATEVYAWAKQACEAHNCSSVKADPAKIGSGESQASSSSSSGGILKELFCGSSSSSSAMAGAVAGLQECDGNKQKCDFSWLCSSMGVCHDGDSGPISNRYGYQCVWYAWTRAAMVYKDTFQNAWNTVQGNGGDIWAAAQGTPGWTVDQTPHAGDIVSGYGGTFTGSGGYGHVAFVEKVENGPNGVRFFISEGNYNTDGSGPWTGYNTRWLNQSDNPSLHFVRHSSWHQK